ncbi:hypothetical protein IMX26_14970 [Clostridium sp. 'deep sea']|uniref:hypothetical protein n=1 Tax=Clostridium sp. 'deep sea' TaxID=2779445 RepID=UPI0018964433|nr:hypothetical protein [Clostridium sp. 'deep sea']QOR34745.1 hypothetical protein IMX26_14970 [Clostridium sp. 'deep sea']
MICSLGFTNKVALAQEQIHDPYEVTTVESKEYTGDTREVNLGVLHNWQQFPDGGSFYVSNSKSKGISITKTATASFLGIIKLSFGVTTSYQWTNEVGVTKYVNPTPWARLVAISHESKYLIKIRHDIHINSNTIIESWYSYHYIWKPETIDNFVEYSTTGPY